MKTAAKRRADLVRENAELLERLHEAEETLQAIRAGDVDALFVAGQLYSLHGAETPYRVFVEAMNEGAASLNEQGTVLYANRGLAHLLHVSLESLIGTSFRHLVVPADRAAFDSMLARTSQGAVRGELYLKGNGSAVVPVQISLRLLNQDAERHISLVAADLTEIKLKEAEIRNLNAGLERRVEERTAALEAANRELEAFSYSVSHDLRAPLRAVDGYSQILLEDAGPLLNDEGRRLLNVVRSETQRMGALIEGLLNLSYLSRQDFTPVPVDMTALAARAFDEAMRLEGPRNVRLDLRDLPVASGEPVMLQQVWVNLVSNALKFTRKREDAAVEIGCRCQDGEQTYYVRDNGAGFEIAHSDRLFGVFQRLHPARDFPGTGVGLALVRRIIARHGGRIWAEGRPDEGATFFFTVPARTAPDSVAGEGRVQAGSCG